MSKCAAVFIMHALPKHKRRAIPVLEQQNSRFCHAGESQQNEIRSIFQPLPGKSTTIFDPLVKYLYDLYKIFVYGQIHLMKFDDLLALTLKTSQKEAVIQCAPGPTVCVLTAECG